MLGKDLLRATVKGREIKPQLIDVARADLRAVADTLVELTERAVQDAWTWGELEEAYDVEAVEARSAKVVRGLAKLLLDRCEAEVDAPMPPVALRAQVFRAARDAGPLALAPDPMGRRTAEHVLDEVGAPLGLSAEALGRALYADLPDAQVVRSFRPLDGGALLRRYNVALVQGLLLRAFEVRVRLLQPTTDRLRQLMRHARFQQLLFRAAREGGEVLIELDGPAAILERSTRYGLNLAAFLPALLLQPGTWTLEAEVTWGDAGAHRLLTVRSTDGLVGDRVDDGAWTPRERAWFLERWGAKAPKGWSVSEDTLPIELGGQGMMLPDLVFTDGKRTAYLEIVGTWRRAWLERRIEALKRHGRGNVILAVSRKFAAAKAEDLAGLPVIPFGEVVPVDAVLAELERVAR